MGFKNETLINTQELGRAIKRHREELKMSLRDVADEIGVSASTLSRIENGTGNARHASPLMYGSGPASLMLRPPKC